MSNNYFGRLGIIVTICLLTISILYHSLVPASKNHSKTSTELSTDNIELFSNTTTSYLIGHFEYYNWKIRDFIPLAFARVGIYDVDKNEYLGIACTDIYGNFTFGPINNPTGINIKCYVYTENLDLSTNISRVTVLKEDTENLYQDQTLIYNIPAGENRSITKEFPDFYKGFTVFSFHSGLNKGWYWIYTATGNETDGAVAHYPSALNPYYDNETQRIHLPTFTYEYTDIILHEYAHYIMHWAHYYSLHYWYWPGSSWDYSHNGTSDPTTAWVEGWAFFFPLAVKNNGTCESDVGPVDFENQHWCSPDWDDGDKVVGRVTGALWDIYDSQNDSAPWYYDNFTDGFNDIWNVMLTQPYNNFSQFWQSWNTSGYPKQPALLAIFQNSIDYRGPGDVDANGFVDIDDLYKVANLFGVLKGDHRWDDRADLNHDDFIDIEDLYTVSLNYGKSYDC